MDTTYHVNRKNKLARNLFAVAFIGIFVGAIYLLVGVATSFRLSTMVTGAVILIVGVVILLTADYILARKPELYYNIYITENHLKFHFSEDYFWQISRNYFIVLEKRKILLYDNSKDGNSFPLELDFDRNLLKFLEKACVRAF